MLKQIRAADKTALHNGDTKAQYAGFEGTMFVSARNPVRPTALDADKTPCRPRTAASTPKQPRPTRCWSSGHRTTSSASA